MTTSVTHPCPFCLKNISNPNFGSHILNKHKDELFNAKTTAGSSNIQRLSSDIYGNKVPLVLDIYYKDSKLTNYWCMTCKKCFHHKARADTHYTEGHPCYGSQRVHMLDLAEQFEGMKCNDKLLSGTIEPVQEIIWTLYAKLEHYVKIKEQLEKKYEPDTYQPTKPFRLENVCPSLVKKVPFSVKYDLLKEKFDVADDDEEEEVAVEERPKPTKPVKKPVKVSEEVEEEAPIVIEQEKPMTQEEVFNMVLGSDPELAPQLSIIKSMYSKPKQEQKPAHPMPSFNPFMPPPVSQPTYPTILSNTKRKAKQVS